MTKEQVYFLIKQILKGEKQSYEVLVNAHKGFVFSLVMNILKNREEAEEVTMDVFVSVYQKLESFHFNSKFSTWLYTIAYRQAIMHIRKRKHDFISLSTDKTDNFNLLYNIYQNEQRVIIEEALNLLNEEDRGLITLYYLNELNLKEIEEVTAIKAETLKVKIHRIRKKLEEILKKQLSVEELNTLL